MKLPFKKEVTPEEKRLEMLKKSHTELVNRLYDIRTMFDFATDSDMIDALIYEEKSVLCRLELLYKTARAEGIVFTADKEQGG